VSSVQNVGVCILPLVFPPYLKESKLVKDSSNILFHRQTMVKSRNFKGFANFGLLVKNPNTIVGLATANAVCS
jgi:hypothetical protein